MMKTGIDIVEIQRFSEMKRIDAFLSRVFTETERAYFSAKKNAAESIAGAYAAKEAFLKYLGTGLREISFQDIEVRHDPLGKPMLFLRGNPVSADLSISHSKTTAVAVVCGEAHTAPILSAEQVQVYQPLLPKRWDTMHKGDCGRVFLVAGSVGMTGAAALSAQAALRCGSGLVTVGTPRDAQPVLATKLTEAMTMPLPAKGGKLSKRAGALVKEQLCKSDAGAIGPGLGKVQGLWKILREALQTGKPLVLDADGLNALAEHIDILDGAHGEVVLTPHLGEMARLCGRSAEEIAGAREAVAAEFAARYRVTLLLKGKDTVIASPSGQLHKNPTGNDGMATGGMGDVLTGVILSFLGRGMDGYTAAVLAAFLHGLAGDLAAERLGTAGMLAGDVLRQLPDAFLMLQKS